MISSVQSCTITTRAQAPSESGVPESRSLQHAPPECVVKTGLPCDGSEIFHRSCQPPNDSRKASPWPGKAVGLTQKLMVACGELSWSAALAVTASCTPSNDVALFAQPNRSDTSVAPLTAAWLAKAEPSFALTEKL